MDKIWAGRILRPGWHLKLFSMFFRLFLSSFCGVAACVVLLEDQSHQSVLVPWRGCQDPEFSAGKPRITVVVMLWLIAIYQQTYRARSTVIFSSNCNGHFFSRNFVDVSKFLYLCSPIYMRKLNLLQWDIKGISQTNLKSITGENSQIQHKIKNCNYLCPEYMEIQYNLIGDGAKWEGLLVPNANLHTCLFLNPFIGIKSLWPDNLAGKVQKWGFILHILEEKPTTGSCLYRHC